MKCDILLFKSQVLWVESGLWTTPARAYFAYFQCLSCSLCHILFVVLVGSPCSCERTLTWGWTSSWMTNTACTMWQRCLKSSWGTCLILFYPGNCTLPSCTPTVRIWTEPYLLKVFVSVSRHLAAIIIVTPASNPQSKPHPCLFSAKRSRAAAVPPAPPLPAPALQLRHAAAPPLHATNRAELCPGQHRDQRRGGGPCQHPTALLTYIWLQRAR